MGETVITARNVTVVLNNHRVLADVSFDIARGDVVAIVGPNGSGKTTLVKAMLGLIPYSGDIRVLGMLPAQLPRVASRIGYVPQHLDFDRTMPVTVEELLEAHLPDRGRKAAVATALGAVQADDLRRRMTGVLSGGEFQRVLLALALLNEPDILFLDEPAAGVDVEGAAEFYELLRDLRKKRNLTVVMISHDIDVVFRHATAVLCINHTLICTGTPHDTLTPETMRHLYGSEQTSYMHKDKKR